MGGGEGTGGGRGETGGTEFEEEVGGDWERDRPVSLLPRRLTLVRTLEDPLTSCLVDPPTSWVAEDTSGEREALRRPTGWSALTGVSGSSTIRGKEVESEETTWSPDTGRRFYEQRGGGITSCCYDNKTIKYLPHPEGLREP